MTEPPVITLGGRTFVPVTGSTLAHDTWYMGLVSRTGLDAIVRRDDETEPEFGTRLLRALLASGAIVELLGGMLVPTGTVPTEWTPQLAAETAAFIGGLEDPQEKDKAYPLMIECWSRFFQNGRRSSASSPPSSMSGEDMTHLLERMTATATGGL